MLRDAVDEYTESQEDDFKNSAKVSKQVQEAINRLLVLNLIAVSVHLGLEQRVLDWLLSSTIQIVHAKCLLGQPIHIVIDIVIIKEANIKKAFMGPNLVLPLVHLRFSQLIGHNL